jgi:Golgi complex component 7 (COG7)
MCMMDLNISHPILPPNPLLYLHTHLSAVGLIVAQLVQIPVLSPQGRAQLLVDIEYISNVVQAMGLRLHPLLSHMHQILLKDPLTLLSAVDSMPVRSPVSIALQRFDSKVAKALCVGHGFVSPDHSRVATPVPITTPPSSHA